jgi:hypothetical protein
MQRGATVSLLSADDPKSRTGLRRFLPRDPWQVLIAPLILLVAGAGITALMSGGKEEKEPKRPLLAALPPVVHNGEMESDAVPAGENLTASLQTEASKPRVEVRLHNTGTRRSVLTSARFTITDFARITPCGLGAGLVASARYDVVLPIAPHSGQVIETPINQQLGPDQADRFVFRLGVGNAIEKILGETLVYELRVAVVHDNESKPVGVGRVVVALPGAVPPDFLQAFNAPGTDDCVQDPPPAARRALRFEGSRSPEVDEMFGALR